MTTSVARSCPPTSTRVGLQCALLIAMPGAVQAQRVDQPATCPQLFSTCRSQLVAGLYLRASTCWSDFLQACADDPRAARAAELRAIARALGQRSPVRPDDDSGDRSPGDITTARHPRTGLPTDLEALLSSGLPRLTASAALMGSTVGLSLGAVTLAILRTPTTDSAPPLLAAGTLGAAAGVLGASAVWWRMRPSASDTLLIASTGTVLTAYGGLLAASSLDRAPLFDQLPPVGLPLLGSVLGTAAGLALSTTLELDPGAVDVMNHAALWGALLPAVYGLLAPPAELSFRRLAGLSLGLSAASYVGALTLAPLIAIERPYLFLVDLGGLLGLFAGAVAFLHPDAPAPRQVGAGLVAGSGLLGAGLGLGAAFMLDRFVTLPSLRLGEPAIAPSLSFAVPAAGQPRVQAIPMFGLLLDPMLLARALCKLSRS